MGQTSLMSFINVLAFYVLLYLLFLVLVVVSFCNYIGYLSAPVLYTLSHEFHS